MVYVLYDHFVSMLHIGWIKNTFGMHGTCVVILCNMILKHMFFAMACMELHLQYRRFIAGPTLNNSKKRS
jgi:hypothetical protein